jgi:hypothetical protein
MESEKKVAEAVVVQKPNYMLMSLQRILVLFIILVGVVLVVYYTPMPGNFRDTSLHFIISKNIEIYEFVNSEFVIR